MKKYISNLLSDNPLCGIDVYNDTLTLSTGGISRNIKKLVLTGQEDWSRNTTAVSGISLFVLPITDALADVAPVCTHYVGSDVHIWRELKTNEITVSIISAGTQRMVVNMGTVFTETDDFKTYLAQQYSDGTPVTVWYVLSVAETETITVPTGLSGTVEGYTTQTGTPTPTSPIYPTSNNVTMWANYTPQKYSGTVWQAATGQPEQYNGSWT